MVIYVIYVVFLLFLLWVVNQAVFANKVDFKIIDSLFEPYKRLAVTHSVQNIKHSVSVFRLSVFHTLRFTSAIIEDDF